jgi:hypothetical protein
MQNSALGDAWTGCARVALRELAERLDPAPPEAPIRTEHYLDQGLE